MAETLVIGVAGGSGSGKTTLARALSQGFEPGQVRVVLLDSYYRSRRGVSPEERARINYDHPEAFDQELLLEHLTALKAGRAIEMPVYDYTVHDRRDETIPVSPPRVVILEGILVLGLEAIVPLLDLKLYVEAPRDIRFVRRLRRDVAERGRSVDSVIEQYLATVRPMHLAFIEPSAQHADLIVPGGGEIQRAVALLRAWIERFLRGGPGLPPGVPDAS